MHPFLTPPWLIADLQRPRRMLSFAPYRPGFRTSRHVAIRQVRDASACVTPLGLSEAAKYPGFLARELIRQAFTSSLPPSLKSEHRNKDAGLRALSRFRLLARWGSGGGHTINAAVIGCVDGMAIGWVIGSKPNAGRANIMLDDALETLWAAKRDP